MTTQLRKELRWVCLPKGGAGFVRVIGKWGFDLIQVCPTISRSAASDSASSATRGSAALSGPAEARENRHATGSLKVPKSGQQGGKVCLNFLWKCRLGKETFDNGTGNGDVATPGVI